MLSDLQSKLVKSSSNVEIRDVVKREFIVLHTQQTDLMQKLTDSDVRERRITDLTTENQALQVIKNKNNKINSPPYLSDRPDRQRREGEEDCRPYYREPGFTGIITQKPGSIRPFVETVKVILTHSKNYKVIQGQVQLQN